MVDYIIVGAGSAGCVLANRLSENPNTTVLLLEAGSATKGLEPRIPAAFSKFFKTPFDWNYEAADSQYWPRGKMLGGSNAMNAMMVVRGHRTDYDQWLTLGNLGWSYDDVLPYFKRAENFAAGSSTYHGANGPMHIENLRSPNPMVQAFIEAGATLNLQPNPDINGAQQDGIGQTHVAQKNGRRWGVVDAYLKPAMSRPNLTVITYAHTTRLSLDGKRVTGVEYQKDGTTTQVTAEREVILSAGSINSPQLLMLSGIGPADHLKSLGIEVRADLPGVGQNLQDHAACGATYECSQPITLAGAEKITHLLNFLLFKKGPLTSNVGEALAFMRTQPNLPAPDIELIFAPTFFMYHGYKNPTGHGFTIGAVLLRPKSRGKIRLSSNNPFAAPIIEPNSFADPADLPLLSEGVKYARRLAQAHPFAPYRGKEVWPGVPDENIPDFVRQNFQTLYHPVGTCKMGRDQLAVVDDHLQVRGVKGLRVVDASIMPTIIGGHTDTPTIMIAEKAADLIKG